MALLTKHRPHHAAIEKTVAEAEALSQDLEQARATSATLKTMTADVEATLKEARIAEAMGDNPPRAVSELKGTLQSLAEQIERAEAKCLGLDRARKAAQEKVEGAKAALKEEQWALFEKLAAKGVETMRQRAASLAEDQRELIALIRLAMRIGLGDQKTAPIIPIFFLYAEIVSSHGGGEKEWPWMGDRKTGDALLAPRTAEICELLDGL